MKIPLKEMLGAIPGMVGIRLEQEPEFHLIHEDGSFQVRRYEPMVLAQTIVEGTHDEAVDEGFRRLADYIFGGNRSKDQMSMTTPVLQAKVVQRLGNNKWNISFVLPEDLTVATAPKPNDPRVKIRLVPQKTVASFRYSGNNTTENMMEAAEELKQWLRDAEFKTIGEIYWAQYDQPFAVPFLKRNEVLFDVQTKSSPNRE